MLTIPPNKQWTQANISDVLGMLWASFNLDLTTVKGKLRISPRFIRATLGSDFSDPAVGTETINGVRLFVGPSDKVWTQTVNSGEITGTISEDSSSSGHPTDLDADYSDIAAFNGAVYISTNSTNLRKTSDASSYSSVSSTSTTGSKPKMLCVYGQRLYISQDGKIYSLDTGDTPQTTTSSDYAINLNVFGTVITRMRPNSQGIWVSTINNTGGKGHVFFWNGVDHAVATDFILESSGAVSLVIKDDVPWILDTEGRLLEFNGGTFVEKARLPIDRRYLYNPLSAKNDRFIHPNGMVVVDGRIQILIDTRYNAYGNPLEERAPAGIWEFDEAIGLYHKASLTYYKYASGSVGDYGQQQLTRVGLLKSLKSFSSASGDKGMVVASASYNNGNMISSTAELWFDETTDAVEKHGHFITQWITAQGVTDTWQKIIPRFRKMLNSGDEMTLKYRTTEDTPTYATVVWDNTHQLTTVTDVSAYVGAEIEFMSGSGAGMCAHITAISGSGPYTLTLDKDITINTGDYTQPTSYAKIQTWKKISSFTERSLQYKSVPIDAPHGVADTKIQFKVCLTCTGKNELDDILVVSAPAKLP